MADSAPVHKEETVRLDEIGFAHVVAEDAQHRRSLEVVKLKFDQTKENRAHIYALARDGFLTLCALGVTGAILYYTGALLFSPNTSQEAKQLATGIWGGVGGAAIKFLFEARKGN